MMKRGLRSLFWVLVFCSGFFWVLGHSLSLAEEPTQLGEVVVTATRTPEPVENVASSITIITAKELKEQGIETLTEALKEVAGVNILQNGFGGSASIYMRGATNGQSIILINGVPIYDPSGLGKGDFSCFLPLLNVDQIDRIEIVRGPQSVLYGSNAMAGAINIITKKALKTGGNIKGEFGSYKALREVFSAYHHDQYTSLSLIFSKKDSKGISKTISDPDQDAYHNGNFEITFAQNISKNVQIGTNIIFSNTSQDLDGSNQKEEDRLSFFNTYIKQKISNVWTQHLDFAFSSTRREYDQGTGGIYKGRLMRLSWQNNYQTTDFAKVIVGFDWQKEWADISPPWGTSFDKSTYEWAPFTQFSIIVDRLVGNLGLRYTKHEVAGDKLTYRLAGAFFPFEWFKLHTSYGTGFRSPSIFQLYDPSYGNKDLKPEKSWGYDAGLTIYCWNKKVNFDVTYFYNKFEDLIEWVSTGTWTGQYQNISGWSKTYGIEFTTQIKPLSWLSFKASYQNLSAKDNQNQDLLRRPRQKASFVTTIYCPAKRGSLSFRGLYVGRYKDKDYSTWPATIVKMGDYFVAYLNMRIKLKKSFTLTADIDNLFNKHYQEIYDYKTRGRSIYLGLEYSW